MRRTLSIATLGALFVFAGAAQTAVACTNFLITRGASADGSTMITYAADSHTLYGELYHTPAATHAEDAMLDVYEWDTGKYLGKIKQVSKTYSVVGNMNEHQVSIGETTYGGRKECHGGKGEMDYGSLMYITLQRAKTAREAIEIMGALVKEYGYISEGESFSVADPEEAWIMEMIGKGPEERGAVWVARRIPDGYVSAHANQARIRQFPLKDEKNCLYAEDVIEFARTKGWYDGPDEDFSFADTYAPLSFSGVRFCEARVWSMFRRVKQGCEIYYDYVKGTDGAEPLPLWIKPDKKITLKDVMSLMRDHFEDTPLDLSKGVGAGPYQLPYRWRPLVWEHEDKKYINERSTSTQQTGFSFVAQMRKDLPDPIGGVLWFGVDDTAATVYIPMYCGIRAVPEPFAVGTGDFGSFSWNSAFWVFNFVSNYTYLRYSFMIQDVRNVQEKLEGHFLAMQASVDQAAIALYATSPELAREYLTDYSVRQGEMVVDRWRELGQFMVWKYLDGNMKDELGEVTHPGYPKEWYDRIVEEDGDHFLKRRLEGEPEEEEH